MAEGYSSDQRGEIRPAAPVFTANGLLIAVIVVGVLYFGREVFVPIALAILLSFVLAIPVGLIQRWGMPRTAAVGLVVVLAFSVILSIGAVLTTQLAQLAGDLPSYQTTIRDKITSLKNAASGHGPMERVADMLQNLSKDIGGSAKPASPAPNAGAQAGGLTQSQAQSPNPVPVQIVGGASGTLDTISTFVAPLLHPLETTGLVAIFVIFILLQRGDLRNRLIRLAGAHDLQRTTAAMNDAASRLSRFFLMQVLLNAIFGIVVGVALGVIGVPSPVLWGILAAVSRFVPYVGVFLAAAGPLILAAAVDPHWSMVVEAAAMFACVELAMGQIVEPLLYGHSTGLSPVAVIVSVTFWAWLWGGVGLVLATPLTVCLVVLGRHVEHLGFLDIMFGDRPPLTAAESFYQRMLAGDVAEGLEQAEAFLKEHSLAAYYDEVALKGLALAQIDASRGALDANGLSAVERTVTGLVEDLSEYEDVVPTSTAKRKDTKRADGDADLDESLDKSDELALPVLGAADLRDGWSDGAPVLCVAGRNELDGAGAQMLAQLLRKHGLGARVESADVLGGAQIGSLDPAGIRMVCLSFLDTSSPVHVRYAVRRLRRRLPDAQILLGSWALDASTAKELCDAARADFCASRLGDAVQTCLDAAQVAEADRTAAPPVGGAIAAARDAAPALPRLAAASAA